MPNAYQPMQDSLPAEGGSPVDKPDGDHGRIAPWIASEIME